MAINLTKELLLNGLDNILNNMLFGLVAPRLVQPDAWVEASKGAALFKGPEAAIQIELAHLSKRILAPEHQDGFLRNYENSLLRAMLRESHELILAYCGDSDQFAAYKAQSWFQFARILRNVVSHKSGGVLHEWPRDLARAGVTNVKWRHRAFDVKMVGEGISFYLHEGLHLLHDQIDFVESKLS